MLILQKYRIVCTIAKEIYPNYQVKFLLICILIIMISEKSSYLISGITLAHISAIRRNAGGQSLQNLRLNTSTFNPKSILLGRKSGSAWTRPMI